MIILYLPGNRTQGGELRDSVITHVLLLFKINKTLTIFEHHVRQSKTVPFNELQLVVTPKAKLVRFLFVFAFGEYGTLT